MVCLQRRVRITILIFLTAISFMPSLTFFIFYYFPNAIFINGLFTGATRISVNVAHNRLDIYGTHFMGITSFDLTFVVLLLISIIVFLFVLIFLMREVYFYQKREKD